MLWPIPSSTQHIHALQAHILCFSSEQKCLQVQGCSQRQGEVRGAMVTPPEVQVGSHPSRKLLEAEEVEAHRR